MKSPPNINEFKFQIEYLTGSRRTSGVKELFYVSFTVINEKIVFFDQRLFHHRSDPSPKEIFVKTLIDR